jgi:hypothetical protein
LIALSAVVIGGINDFETWLGTDKLVTHERPMPLVEGVLDRGGTYQYPDDSGRVQTEQLLTPSAVVVRRDKPSAQDVIVPLVRKLVVTARRSSFLETGGDLHRAARDTSPRTWDCRWQGKRVPTETIEQRYSTTPYQGRIG